MRFIGSCLILGGALMVFTGCGVREAEVSGTVLVDADQPLPEGEIIFEEVDKSKTPGAGKIKDGKYTVKVLPGSKIVRITASRSTGKPDPLMGADGRESMLGDDYNLKSTLKTEIKPGKQEGVDFKVKSLPKS